MDNGKIVITSEECDNATPHNSGIPWQPPVNAGEPEERKTGKKVFLAVLITCLVFATAGMAVYCLTRLGGGPSQIEEHHPKTVSQFRAEFIKKTNEMLKDPNADVRKYVENAHLTVTVSQAYVINCNVKTIDGSDWAGDDNSNVSEVDVTIRHLWNGNFHSGRTDLEIRIDYLADKVISYEIVYTDAIVNIEDPSFWLGLGTLLLL